MKKKSNCSCPDERFVILRSFIDSLGQSRLAKEALQCHESNFGIGAHQHDELSLALHEGYKQVETSTSSLKLSIKKMRHNQEDSEYGSRFNDFQECLPLAAEWARKAFGEAQLQLQTKQEEECPCCTGSLKQLATANVPLSGVALLYGPNASMASHYDSPTQPNQTHEWIVIFSLGAAVEFQLNQSTTILYGGDVLVMDSMATLHGVCRILSDPSTSSTTTMAESSVVLPVEGSRLGILFWQGHNCSTSEDMMRKDNKSNTVVSLDGMTNIFDHDDDDY